jgi:hypothetical protein
MPASPPGGLAGDAASYGGPPRRRGLRAHGQAHTAHAAVRPDPGPMLVGPLTDPLPMAAGAAGGRSGGAAASCASSGPLTLVLVPDAGMEAEVCGLLARQGQQTPVPVPVPQPAAGLGPASQGAAGGAGRGLGLGPGVPGVGAGEGCEDGEDALARECFLWDLGTWVECRAAHAVEAEVAALAALPGGLSVVALPPAGAEPQRPPRSLQGSGTSGGGSSGASRALQSLLRPSSTGARRSCRRQALRLPMPALELLGFACSRGWAATASHLVTGLLDMGFSLAEVNAGLQVRLGEG